jgi:cytosine/adenosine deaminase-related metal-dependent hydrolase
MVFHKFQADEMFTGYELLGNGYVVITDEQGAIDAIVLEQDAGDNIQKLHGLLSPGFINCHCHLELSHLKNVIPPHTGLIEFLCSVVTKRNFDPAIIQDAIVKAEKEMWNNGIVAVGDIGNTADTADVKSKSKIRWHNFVEVLGFTDEKAEENIESYRSVLQQLLHIGSRSSLVPHAPYSVSPKTFRLINQLTQDQVISIHNQEHPAEDELYKTGGGEYLKLFKIFGVNESPFPVTGKSSIRSCLPYFSHGQTIFLIHNTYMPEEDIIWANSYAAQNDIKLIYCLCPNANLYIENRLPPVELFAKHGCQLVLGTDSYSSNWQLSIATEVQALTAVPRFETVAPLAEVLRWATINGAKALQWANDLGSFERGKKPGVALIDKHNWTSRRLI